MLHGIIELHIKVRSFSTAKGYVQRHRHLKKGTKGKVLRTELKKMTIFTRKTMNYRTERKLIFTLPQLIVGELMWIGNFLEIHSLALISRVDWTSKKMLKFFFLFIL